MALLLTLLVGCGGQAQTDAQASKISTPGASTDVGAVTRVSLQALNMTHVGCGEVAQSPEGPIKALSAWRLACNGDVETSIELGQRAPYTVQVFAAGEYAGGQWPVFQVLLDGVPASRTTEVSSAAFSEYTVVLRTPSGGTLSGPHRLAVAFINDYYGGTPQTDRNLLVSSVSVVGTASTAITTVPATMSALAMTFEEGAGQVAPNKGQEGRSWLFYGNGYLEEPVQFPDSARYTFDLSASGQLAGGAWPLLQLSIDGKATGEPMSVRSATSMTLETTAEVSAGVHAVRVAFVNDYYGGSPETDRNVVVDSLRVTHATGPSSGDRVLIVYNSNATQDQDGDGVQDSLEVAQYYAARRGVPPDHLLGIAFPGVDGIDSYEQLQGVLDPLRAKLTALGPTNIDILLMSYLTPNRGVNSALDNVLMAPFWWTPAIRSVYWTYNPYAEPTPGFGADHGAFSHDLYKFAGTEMYLVSRLDGPNGVNGVKNLVDDALYGDRFIGLGEGQYRGNVYVDSQNRVSASPYTDAYLASQPQVISGNYNSYEGTDLNIAYGEHWVAPSGLTLKWESTNPIIGQEGAVFSDGSSAASAPQALIYGGWYAYGNYLPVWDWLPGSVATDLDSISLAYTLRDIHVPAWATKALMHGASAVCGVVDEPYTTGNPRPNVLIWALLQGRNFAEVGGLANPSIGWMPMCIGDPLYAPFRAKPLVADTFAPQLEEGYPKATWTNATGTVLHVLVKSSPEPEVAKVTMRYGPGPSYGEQLVTESYHRWQDIPLNNLRGGVTYHYALELKDPVGNVSSTPDLTFVTPPQLPYRGKAADLPGVIQAEDFDEGGEGIGYHDSDPGNYSASQPRADTGVEVTPYAPTSVLFPFQGEWLAYTATAARAGTYTLDIYGANMHGAVQVFVDGREALHSATVGQGSSAATLGALQLSAGQHTLKVVFAVGSNDSQRFADAVDRFEVTAN